MLETPAKLISSVFIGLGRPESELLQEFEVAQVVFRKLAYYYEGIRQSDQNLLAEKTSEFTLASGANSKDLTSLTSSDTITPLWCEQKVYDSTNDTWRFVPTVNMDTLPERREQGITAVGFYGDTANQITAEFSCYGDDLTAPYNTFRVWYAPANTFSANKDATITVPDTLTYVIETDAKLACIPILLVNASKYMDKRPELAARVSAWESLAQALMTEKAEWTERFETWRKRSRGSHRAINHNDVLGLGSDWRY